MVAHTNCFGASSSRYFNCFGWWYSRCSFRLHTFLVQKVYKNIVVLIAGFCALHLLFGGKVFLIIALVVLLLSALSEKAATAIETAWLFIGEKLGKINAAILLFLIYYLFLTPIAFLSRIGSKDPLQLKAPEKSNFLFKSHKYVAEDLKNPW